MPAVGGFYHGYDDDDVSVALVSKQRPCKRAAALSLAMEKDAGIWFHDMVNYQHAWTVMILKIQQVETVSDFFRAVLLCEYFLFVELIKKTKNIFVWGIRYKVRRSRRQEEE